MRPFYPPLLSSFYPSFLLLSAFGVRGGHINTLVGGMGVLLDGAILLGMLVSAVTAAAVFAEGWLLRLSAVVVSFTLFAGSALVLARLRHGHLIARAAAAEQLRLLTLSGTNGFVNPPELPWWRGWAKYEMEAARIGAGARRYHVFVTGVLFCMFSVSVTLSTDDDYEWSCDRPETNAPPDQPRD